MARPRKKKTRVPHPSTYIFCEGEKTEPNYFNAFIDSLSFPGELATVKVVHTDKTNLVGLVDEAKKFKDNNAYALGSDEYWIVVDKDGYPKHKEGFEAAKRNSFKIAFSSICFEYWLLCHYTFSKIPYQNYREIIRGALIRHIPEYTKNNGDIFSITNELLETACQNARASRDRWVRKQPDKEIYELNPYTNVDELMQHIFSFRKNLSR